MGNWVLNGNRSFTCLRGGGTYLYEVQYTDSAVNHVVRDVK